MKSCPPWKFIQRAHGGALLCGPLAFRWTTAVRPSFSSAKCTSRRPGCGGAGRRGPRDRRVTAEHVTQPASTSARVTCSRVRVRSRGLSDVLASRGASRHARRRPTMRDDWRGWGHQNLSRRRPTRRSRRARPSDAPGGDPSRPPPRPSRSTPSKPPLNNIPGAWCSLTARAGDLARWAQMSQCTYRCVVLPDW